MPMFYLAAVLACYGFSVLLRSVSEWWYFRRHPGNRARRYGRWWSPLVGLVALGSSGYPPRGRAALA